MCCFYCLYRTITFPAIIQLDIFSAKGDSFPPLLICNNSVWKCEVNCLLETCTFYPIFNLLAKVNIFLSVHHVCIKSAVSSAARWEVWLALLLFQYIECEGQNKSELFCCSFRASISVRTYLLQCLLFFHFVYLGTFCLCLYTYGYIYTYYSLN